ncbi:hypothetical protein MBLNU457_5438t1 [Dothideomycetes sp. NU457]
MPARAVSPTASENEFDISKSLFGSGADAFGDGEDFLKDAGAKESTIDLRGEESDDGDAIYIAAQQAANNRKTANQTKGPKRSGGFQSLGLNSTLLKAISRKGFTVPTPIQRKTLPLIMDGQDVVGMARTGSGKTAAFVIPMLEKLKTHSAKVGARAVVLSPSRELALQTLKVIRELGKGTDLRTVLLVGGDSLEEQFSSMASNPDIIIATPGRFEHLKVEMNLELSSVKYVVFDEADRLFEMGFAAQLAEIIISLPPTRQTLLFSATLPKSLVEFARAGLQEPKLVRLDAESKISPDLESAFFMINSAEKEGALLHLVRDVIKIPSAETVAETRKRQQVMTGSNKRKRGPEGPKAGDTPTPHSTIVFAATKHHVDYLANLLKTTGYAVSYVYGALDQTARKEQVENFRTGLSNILVVTDVAARGIDIPILANVINYDFPPQPKVFVHRVGRTARAGKKGWSYNLVTATDLPYLLDLQLFLGQKLVQGRDCEGRPNYAETVVIGTFVREDMERNLEEVNKLLEEDIDLSSQKEVAGKGEKQYVRTRNSASAESVMRAKTLGQSQHLQEPHMLFEAKHGNDMEKAREQMLARVSGFRPTETVFEIGRRGDSNAAAEIMRQRREKIQPRKRQKIEEESVEDDEEITTAANPPQTNFDEDEGGNMDDVDLEEASEDELEITFSQPNSNKGKRGDSTEQDSEFFMSYRPQNTNVAEDRGYGVHSGSYNDSRNGNNFLAEARNATMDLNADDTKAFGEPGKAKGLRWDKKSKRYVARANDEDGSRGGGKMIKGESGLKIPAAMRSGRFDAWRKANKVEALPRVGEMEKANRFSNAVGKRYKHKAESAPKEADRYRDDYYTQKKKVQEAKEKRVGKFGAGNGKNEIRGVDDVRKQRAVKQKRKDKNARPSRKRA